MLNILLVLEHAFPRFPGLCQNCCTLCSHPCKHQSSLPKETTHCHKLSPSSACHQLHLTITFPLQRNPSCHLSTDQVTPGQPKLLDTSQLTHCLLPVLQPFSHLHTFSRAHLTLCGAGVHGFCQLASSIPTHSNSCSPGLLLLDELLWPFCPFADAT